MRRLAKKTPSEIRTTETTTTATSVVFDRTGIGVVVVELVVAVELTADVVWVGVLEVMLMVVVLVVEEAVLVIGGWFTSTYIGVRLLAASAVSDRSTLPADSALIPKAVTPFPRYF